MFRKSNISAKKRFTTMEHIFLCGAAEAPRARRGRVRVSEARDRPRPEASQGPSTASLHPRLPWTHPSGPRGVAGRRAGGTGPGLVNQLSESPAPAPGRVLLQTDQQPPEPRRKGPRAEVRCRVSLTCGRACTRPWGSGLRQPAGSSPELPHCPWRLRAESP